jgi:selenocysteine lyase/cysteine desulfurase
MSSARLIVDAVEHAPHGITDDRETQVVEMNVACYQFFGCGGSGIIWLSDRMAHFQYRGDAKFGGVSVLRLRAYNLSTLPHALSR